MYWGKYVQHDNNRDGMGQYLKITQNFTKGVLEWHPTVLHDLHEAQSYLYVSTGTGPYNTVARPDRDRRMVAAGQTEVMEMAKRGVPGVFTYGFYDGWVPNYLFWIAHHAQLLRPLLRSAELRPGREPEPARSAPRRPAANGTGPIRRCPPSPGDRATTPTSRNRRC